MKDISTVEEGFYEKCGDLIGILHTSTKVYEKRTRWNNRLPGNGRYIGWGVIRRHSSNYIHVCRNDTTKVFHSEDDVFKFIENR